MALQYSPKIVTDGLVMCLDPSQNKSYPTTDLPVKGGLVMWMDAADDTTFSYSSGTTVTQWRDKSGLNYHMTPAAPLSTGPSRNTFLNSRKTLTFTTSQSIGSLTFTLETSANTVFVVSRYNNYPTNVNRVLTAYYNNWLLGHWGGYVNEYYAEGWIAYAVNTGDSTWRMYMGDWGGASNDVANAYSNGTLITNQTTSQASAGPKGLGINYQSGEPSACEVAEIIAFNRLLSATERNQIHTYLGQKWGILNTDRRIIDLSGFNDNGLFGDGTASNMPAYDYYNKGAFRFDGSNDFIKVGANSSLQVNNVTIAAFFKTVNNGQSVQFIAGYGDTGLAGYWIGMSGGPIRFSVGGGSGNYLQQSSGITPNNDQIYYVVGTYDGTNQRIYVNGALQASATTVTGNISYTGLTDGFLLGQVQGFTAGRYLTGYIYYTQVYNRALSAAEISQNYEALKSRFANTIVQQGLALNLDAGNPYSYAGAGTVWYDTSGNSNNGTLTNGPTYNADAGGNVVFDGSNDYVAVTSAASIKNTSTLSLEGWVLISSAMNYYGGIIGKGTTDSDEEYCLLVHSVNSKVYMDVGSGGGPYTDASFSFSLNTWYHIIGTHERIAGSSTIKIYVNGSLLSSSTVNPTNAVNDNATNASIGSRFNGGTSVWNGKIATARIYTRTLSANEVLQNYNATKGRFGL